MIVDRAVNRLEHSNIEKAKIHFRKMMSELGLDVESEHLEDTPRRFVGMLSELFFEESWNFTTFENPNRGESGVSDQGIVIVRDIPFTSLCSHHFALVTGTATVSYVPDRKLAGLSKLARAVQSFAKGPNVQELIGQKTADFLVEHLEPVGVAVILKATHTCMTERGVKAHGSETVTSALRGCFYTDPSARAELMSLLKI